MTEPLPYVVKLRAVASDDAAPVVTEVRCLAYSPLDACTQAMVQTLGVSGDSDKCKVETVGPDYDAWLKMRTQEKEKQKR